MYCYASDAENCITIFGWCSELYSAYFVILLVIIHFTYMAVPRFAVHVFLFDINFNEYDMKKLGW